MTRNFLPTSCLISGVDHLSSPVISKVKVVPIEQMNTREGQRFDPLKLISEVKVIPVQQITYSGGERVNEHQRACFSVWWQQLSPVAPALLSFSSPMTGLASAPPWRQHAGCVACTAAPRSVSCAVHTWHKIGCTALCIYKSFPTNFSVGAFHPVRCYPLSSVAFQRNSSKLMEYRIHLVSFYIHGY